MVYRFLRLIFPVYLFAVVPGAIDAQPVVRQVTVTDANHTQFYIYSYDTDGSLLYERIQTEEEGIRTNKQQTEWVSSGDSLKIQRIWNWQEGKWVAVQFIRTRYADNKKYSDEHVVLDKQGETIVQKSIVNEVNGVVNNQLYQRVNNELKLKQLTSTLLNEQRKTIIQQTYFNADTVSGWFVTETIRDSLGRIDSLITDLNIKSESANERQLTRYFYANGDKKVVSQLTRKWHPLAGDWENIQRVEYTYRPDGQIYTETFSYFRELRWLATHRYTYDYYPDGVLKEKILSGSIYRQWRKLSTVSYADLSQGYPRTVRSVYNFWGGKTGSNASTDLVYYFNGNQQIRRAYAIDIEYQDETAFNHSSNNLIYPNPTEGILFLRETGTLLVRWEVYDLQGKRVVSQNSDFPVNRIDLTTLPAGIYLVRVTDNQQRTSMQKITKY